MKVDNWTAFGFACTLGFLGNTALLEAAGVTQICVFEECITQQVKPKFVANAEGDSEMSQTAGNDAWNNFVMNSSPGEYPKGSIKEAAAIAKTYMGQANNGGLNSFLTNNWGLDAKEVHIALETIGALIAAKQFKKVLDGLGVPVPASTQDERWDLLERHWSEELNDFDSLSEEADKDLMQVLEKHVQENESFYLSLE
jgi:hypothetical protein